MAFAIAIGFSFGHGASKGLHLHASPDPIAPGKTLTVDIESTKAFTKVELGTDYGGAHSLLLEEPQTSARLQFKVPVNVNTETINLHVEATLEDGEFHRGSAIVKVQHERIRRGGF